MAQYEIDPSRPLILIAGAGVGGLAAGIAIRQELKYDNFLIFEKKTEVGGTWRENTYPGCGCDVPSHWYSLSRDPNPDWSQSFSSQPEIQQYMKDVATRNKLRPHIRFGHHLVSSEWDSKMHYYNVEYETTSTSGATVKSSIKAHAIISAMGGLHIPKMPDIPGINDFQGTMFHSAQWRHDVDLKGKTVGIIGNGCSSCQIVPAITEDSSVNVVNFCRTPAWFAPRPQIKFWGITRWIFRYVPFVHKLYRLSIAINSEFGFLAWVKKMKGLRLIVEWVMGRYMKRNSPKSMHDKLIPKYAFGCKRIIRDPGYLRSLFRPNVLLEWDPIVKIVKDGIITKSGTHHHLDILVPATGFDTTNIAPPVTGVGGKTMAQYFEEQEGPTAYCGTTIPGFPNIFLILGPNVASGHASAIFVEEVQVEYAVKMIKPIIEGKLLSVDVKEKATDDYNNWLQKSIDQTVWSTCVSWYNQQGGKNVAMFPHFVIYFWGMMRTPKWKDYILTSA